MATIDVIPPTSSFHIQDPPMALVLEYEKISNKDEKLCQYASYLLQRQARPFAIICLVDFMCKPQVYRLKSISKI